jgi:3-dehydroquinate synthase
MMNLTIHSNIRDYEAVFEETDDFIAPLAKNTQSCFVVDERVWKIYSPTLLKWIPEDQVMIIHIHENRKNLDTVQELYDRLVEYPAKRNLTMVSIGGGILQDISGFAASTMYRGIGWIYVPTTLLAQADSCIGSKTSLNYQSYKNLVGTFYPPTRIHIYTPFLETLQESDFYSGLGEVIKLHLMGGRETYESLGDICPLLQSRDAGALTKAIKQSLNIKISYMADDEFDMGRRNLLNYGHDFGHAVESTSNFEVPHGQAVILGMIAANIAARQRGILHSSIEKEVADKVLFPNLMLKPQRQALDSSAMINAMKKDKKRVGSHLALIVMDNDFVFSRINDLTEEEASFVLEELHSRLGYKT